MKNEEKYNKYLKHKIENIQSPEQPEYLWSRVKGAINQDIVSENNKGLFSLFSVARAKLVYTFVAIVALSVISLRQYQDYKMYKEVNQAIGEYISYVSSSETSLIQDETI